MYQALLDRDSTFEGLFFAAIRTTGIFCRPSCRARKPRPENVEFFRTSKEALAHGYRPCKICQPMSPLGDTPEWVRGVLSEIEESPQTLRMNDQDLRERGVDPNRLRRWFKRNHDMTFQAFLRSVRLGVSFGHLAGGKKVIDSAFETGYESLSGFSTAFKKETGFSPSFSSQKTALYFSHLLTPLGPMMVGMTTEGVCLLEFTDRRALETEIEDLKKRLGVGVVTVFGNEKEVPHLASLKEQVSEYFSGKRKEFSIPLVTPGSEFQNRVWQGLLDIPYGKTRSYQEQAVALGKKNAVRAVARANGQNRIAILIPCHRVIGKNGELVGYAGGLHRKKYLLDLEGA